MLIFNKIWVGSVSFFFLVWYDAIREMCTILCDVLLFFLFFTFVLLFFFKKKMCIPWRKALSIFVFIKYTSVLWLRIVCLSWLRLVKNITLKGRKTSPFCIAWFCVKNVMYVRWAHIVFFWLLCCILLVRKNTRRLTSK